MSKQTGGDCDVDFWLDPDMTLWFSIRCPKCRTVHEHKADDLPKGFTINCQCGAALEIDDDEFERSQRDLRKKRLG